MKLRPISATAQKVHLARKLRRGLTTTERRVWDLLRGRRMLGFKFRRQHVIAGVIVDFYCPELRLAIELDGVGHQSDEQSNYDAARAIALAARGLHVIRFQNAEVSADRMRSLLLEFSRRPPSPRSGEGDRG